MCGQRSSTIKHPSSPAMTRRHRSKGDGSKACSRLEPTSCRKEYSKRVRCLQRRHRTLSAASISFADLRESPPGTWRMIFAYMKTLDPGSVVRESEFSDWPRVHGSVSDDQIQAGVQKRSIVRQAADSEAQRADFLAIRFQSDI